MKTAARLMRMRSMTHVWLCGLIFCCAGAAMAQTSPSSVSAAENPSAEASVSAAVNASANASVNEAQVSSSISRSGGGSGSRSALSAAGVSEISALQPGGRVSPSPSMNAFAGLSDVRLRAAHENRSLVFHNPPSASRQTVVARDSGKPRRRANGVEEPAAYSADFADSTKGTALISPPDSGTASPLDWTQGLTFEFGDFAQAQFLNPSLHVGASRKGAVKKGGRKAPSQPVRSTSIEDQVGLNAPSVDQDILGEAQSASMDQQLGLQ